MQQAFNFYMHSVLILVLVVATIQVITTRYLYKSKRDKNISLIRGSRSRYT